MTHEQQQVMYDLVKDKIATCDRQARKLSDTSRELINIKTEMIKTNKDLV